MVGDGLRLVAMAAHMGDAATAAGAVSAAARDFLRRTEGNVMGVGVVELLVSGQIGGRRHDDAALVNAQLVPGGAMNHGRQGLPPPSPHSIQKLSMARIAWLPRVLFHRFSNSLRYQSIFFGSKF